MKSLFRLSLVVVLAFNSLVMNANEANIGIDKNAKTTNVSFNNVKAGTQLTIKDVYSEILYKEVITTNGVYTKGFDFSALPNGNYVVELTKEFQIEVVPFIVSNTEVNFNYNEVKVINKPIVYVKNKKVVVSKLAFESNSVEVFFYNDKNTLIFSEVVKSEESIQRLYSLESIQNTEEIRMVLLSDGKTYTKDIQL